MLFELRVLGSGLIAWLHQDTGLPHAQITKVENDIWACIETAWSSADPNRLFYAVQLQLPLAAVNTEVMALLCRHVPECTASWKQPHRRQKAPPFGYQVSDDTSYLGVYPSKHLILWNRTTEEHQARVLHILVVAQQYAKGYFRVLEWSIQRFKNTRHTIKSLLFLASKIVLLHLAEHRGTLWCMMGAPDPLNDLEALCRTYSGLGDEPNHNKKVSQFSRKEWIQWKKNVQTLDLTHGLFLTIVTRRNQSHFITLACLSSTPPSKNKIHKMYLEFVRADSTNPMTQFWTQVMSALCYSLIAETPL